MYSGTTVVKEAFTKQNKSGGGGEGTKPLVMADHSIVCMHTAPQKVVVVFLTLDRLRHWNLFIRHRLSLTHAKTETNKDKITYAALTKKKLSLHALLVT